MSNVSGYLRPFFSLLPTVEKPVRRVGFAEKLFWTGLVLILYLIMCEIPLYGLRPGALEDPLSYVRVIFASSRGTLMELGIGPIITAGLILQLLVGAGILKINLAKTEDRAFFTRANKLAAIVITALQALILVAGRGFGVLTAGTYTIIFMQLMVAGILLILMDELLQKGWGIGSGISLFIVAGVAKTIWWSCFAPVLPTADGKYFGAIPALIQTLVAGESLWAVIHRIENLPSLIGLFMTLLVFLIIIYTASLRIEIPIAYFRFRGFRGRYPIKLLYVSTIPVILTSALFMNLYMMAQILWSRFNQDGTNVLLNSFGTFRLVEEGRSELVGGLVYYLTPPSSLDLVIEDPIRSLVYLSAFTTACVIFAMIWVQLGGLDSKTVAKQLLDAGMHVPGFRHSERPIVELLDRYIPTITILSGLIVGTIAASADFLGVFGSGMGILLAVDILYNYYEHLMRERIAEMYPAIYRLFR